MNKIKTAMKETEQALKELKAIKHELKNDMEDYKGRFDRLIELIKLEESRRVRYWP